MRGLLRYAAIAALAGTVSGHAVPLRAQQDPAPVIVVETSRGAFAFRTFPVDAPKTVAHIVSLVRAGFYDGQRIHRSLPGFLVQFGDPQTRDLSKRPIWGRGAAASSGAAIGVAEISRKRPHVAGSVGVAHMGEPAQADSQIYITIERRPDLDGQYVVFAQVVEGADVPATLRVGDEIIRAYVRE